MDNMENIVENGVFIVNDDAKVNADMLDPPDDLVFDDVNNSVQETAGEAEITEEPIEEAEDAVEEVEDAVEEVDTAEEDGIPEWIGEYVNVTNAHFQNLRSLIKYTKSKDESIYKLSNELQKYREDYCAKIFKPIGMAAISFREDCRKSLIDIGKYQYDAAKVDKYLDFLADDYFDMLSNVGIEEGDDGWLFNGRAVKETEEEKALTFVKPFTEPEVSEESSYEIPVVKSTDDLIAFLTRVEDDIKVTLKTNEMLDKCMKAYVDFSFNFEKDLVKLIVLPSVRMLLSVGDKLRNLVDGVRKELTEENCNCKYTECLEYVINALEDILIGGGITVDTDLNDDFDPKKHRLLKSVATQNESLDRKIVSVHTECYVMNERIIYPSKVDVYKYTPVTEDNQNN